MASDWTEKALVEVAHVVGGGTPSTGNPALWGGDVPWLTPKDLSGVNSVRVSGGERAISAQGLKESSAKLLPAGTVLFSSRAPIGYVAIAGKPMATSQGFKSLVLKDGNDSGFFYYLLKHHKESIEALASGSTFKEVSGSVLGQFKVLVPPPEEQTEIASVLGALDDRIENLRATNETLEAIVQALFKSWFVDFDPVKAKAEGKAPVGMDEETARLFPSEFEESELGLIPKGWSVAACLDQMVFSKGVEPGTAKYQPARGPSLAPFIRVGDLTSRRLDIFVSAVEFANALVSESDILISLDGTVGMVRRGYSGVISSGIRKVTWKDGSASSFVYCQLKSDHFQGQLERFTPAYTTIPHAGKALPSIRMLAPNSALVAKFNSEVDSFMRLILANEGEMAALAATRDELLPKLISGELRLPGFGDNAS